MNFWNLIKGTAKSNTMQFNGIIAVVWSLLQNETVMGGVQSLLTNLIGSNADAMTLLSAIGIIGNIFFRAKTAKPLSER